MEVPLTIAPEKTSDESTLHFESGRHPSTDSEYTTVYNGFYNGDLDAHTWNKEVSERIASYAFDAPALLLTIDGVPTQPRSAYPLFTTRDDAIADWVRLPARPNKLNHTGKVYLVKGDNDYYRLPNAILPNIQEPDSLKQQMDAITNSERENGTNNSQLGILGESAIVASVGTALWAASKLLSSTVTEQRISRRQFLSKALVAATGVAVAGSILRSQLGNLAAIEPHEPTAEFLQTVEIYVHQRLGRSTFDDGRLGILLSKAEDAQATLENSSQAENVVVMGSMHMDIAKTYTQNKMERNTAIAAYAQELLAVAKQVYSSYYHLPPDQIPSQVTNSLLNYVSQTDIVEVTDPGGSSFQQNFPSTVDKQFTPYKSFNSSQVEEAIKDLRPAAS